MSNAIQQDTGFEIFTPERAEEVLTAHNGVNRRLSPAKVRQYADDMREGRWKASPEAIAFDWNGSLIQGQHRLAAVAESGEAVSFLVVRGCDPAVFDVLDSGLKRNAAQLLGANGNAKSASVKGIRVLTGNTARHSSRGSDNKATNAQVVASFEEWKSEIERYLPDARTIREATTIKETALLPVVCVAARTAYADRIEDFLDGLRTGIGLDEGDPRLALRALWMRDRAALGTDNARALTVMTKAWNAFATGRKVGILRYSKSEQIPEVVGAPR